MMLVDDEGERLPQVDILNLLDERQIALHRSNDSEFSEAGSVSCLRRCQSEEAKKLCIYDLHKKLKNSGDYDIGGTYTGNESDLWFYFSTSICPGNNYLLNLLVCHRKVGNFSIGVSKSTDMKKTERPNEVSGWSVLPRSLTWYTYKSAQPNEVYHVKTFCFNEKDYKALERNALFIPISIVMNSSHCLNNDVLMSIKLEHDLGGLLLKKERTDFELISVSGKKFPVHKIILVTHSPVLKNLIKDTENNSLFIDIPDSDMELLLQFLYTGSLKNITMQDCMNMLKVADKFKLENLFLLAQYAIGEQINVESAVDIALISKKYNLAQLQSKVFCFIKNNPKVMQTDPWKNLNDVDLTKQLIEHIYAGRD